MKRFVDEEYESGWSGTGVDRDELADEESRSARSLPAWRRRHRRWSSYGKKYSTFGLNISYSGIECPEMNWVQLKVRHDPLENSRFNCR